MCAGFFIDTFHYFFIGVRSLADFFALFCSFGRYGQPFGVAKRLVCSYLLVCSAVVIVFAMHIDCCGCCSFVFAHAYKNLLISFRCFFMRAYAAISVDQFQCYGIAVCIIACPYANLNRIKTERVREIRSTFIYFSIACASDLQVSTASPLFFYLSAHCVCPYALR